MSTSRRISLARSLALASAGLVSTMTLVVLPAGAVDVGQGPDLVGLLAGPVIGPINKPDPLDINVSRPTISEVPVPGR